MKYILTSIVLMSLLSIQGCSGYSPLLRTSDTDVTALGVKDISLVSVNNTYNTYSNNRGEN